MSRRKPWIWYTAALFFAAAVGGCASTATRMQTAAALDRALAAPQRAPAERARDVYRHPRETLLFFGLRPEMTVLEVSPGTGWYTKVLGPVLRDRGRLLVAMEPLVESNPDSVRTHERFRALLDAAPGALDRVEIVPFGAGRMPATPEGSVDLVVAFRELHGWLGNGSAATVLAELYRVLKPGGILGLVDHRGNPATQQDPQARSGYVNQSYAVRLAESAGFRLVATSEINANPKDTRDHPRGVWNLPPSLTEGEKDRAKYLAIGESDRFTLKFVKPR
ncbi:MAG: methyltransferase domain-containing protein [Steroidobacteraceae bacterium]